MAFNGFPEETFAFLDGLARNNSKAWFDAHRDDYDALYVADICLDAFRRGAPISKWLMTYVAR